MVIVEKMGGSSFYAYHSEFYLVQVNTHTDFGGLMQQMDCRTRKWMRELFINRKWHHCTTISAKAVVWCLGSQYHKNASSALLVIWYLLCSRAIWRKMTNGRLRAPVVVRYWNLGPYPLSVPLLLQKACCSNQHIPIHSCDISSQCFLCLGLLLGWTLLLICVLKLNETRLQFIMT